MIIFGFKTYTTMLAVLTLVCARCHNPAAQRLQKVQRKFTLFFIPLFPTSTRHLLDCTFCGQRSSVTQEQAEQLQHQGALQQGQQYGGQQGQQYGGQQQGDYQPYDGGYGQQPPPPQQPGRSPYQN